MRLMRKTIIEGYPRNMVENSFQLNQQISKISAFKLSSNVAAFGGFEVRSSQETRERLQEQRMYLVEGKNEKLLGSTTESRRKNGIK